MVFSMYRCIYNFREKGSSQIHRWEVEVEVEVEEVEVVVVVVSEVQHQLSLPMVKI